MLVIIHDIDIDAGISILILTIRIKEIFFTKSIQWMLSNGTFPDMAIFLPRCKNNNWLGTFLEKTMRQESVNSSIGDLVTHSLTEPLLIFDIEERPAKLHFTGTERDGF